jgi:hypothetical protein
MICITDSILALFFYQQKIHQKEKEKLKIEKLIILEVFSVSQSGEKKG